MRWRFRLLCGIILALALRNRYQYDSKLRTDRVGLGKDAHHVVWRGIGRDIVICGLAPKQQIAHASADQVGLVPAPAQGINDRDGELPRHVSMRPKQRI